MDLMSLAVNNEDPMEIIILRNFETTSTVMEFHVYRSKWQPVIGQLLKTHEVDKYAVAVLDDKENNVVGHLPKGQSGKYAKTIFYFLSSDPLNSCFVKVTGKAINMGDDKGMRIPCLLEFSGNGESIQLLKKLLCT